MCVEKWKKLIHKKSSEKKKQKKIRKKVERFVDRTKETKKRFAKERSKNELKLQCIHLFSNGIKSAKENCFKIHINF